MKIQFFLISIFCALNANAQDYFITFSGSGASSSVSTVKVENLTAGTSLIVNGNDILHLTSILTGVNSIKDDQSEIKIYPNPTSDNATMQIYAPVAGDAVISVFDITGKPVARIQSYLENSRQDFNLSGLKTGFYFINVRGKNFQLSEKLLSKGQSGGTVSIEKVNVVIQKTEEKAPEKRSKGVQATVDMAYASGDRLKFTGISGNYSTVKTDIPTSDKTMVFNFIYCTDADNNNYPVVEIGSQVWMAESLQTTKYNNGDVIGTTHAYFPIYCEVDPKYQWAWQDPDNFGVGRLYTWFAIMDSRNVCPTGWHVPTDGEWKTLEKFLGMTQEQVDSLGFRGIDQGSQLKNTKGWSREGLQINPNGTNSFGFSASANGYSTNSGTWGGGAVIGSWWSSEALSDFSKAWGRSLYYNSRKLGRMLSLTNYGHSVRCLQGEARFLPTLTTTAASNIAQTTGSCGGNITSDGSSTITARGICWSLSANPTIENNKTFDGTGTGTFTSSITGLSAGTAYYLRAYATNSAGTNYGNEIIINTVVTDIDGNVYNKVTIGTQVWMVENLKTTKFNNGDLIGTTSTATKDIRTEDAPKYQWAYNGNENNVETYGRLYTWYAVTDSRNVCPDHWHVPTQAEWTTLTDYLGGLSISGGKLKEAGTSHWMSPNTGATNETGFTAFPGGYRLSSGGFGGLGSDGAWRSSTLDNSNEDWTIGMGNNYADVYGSNNSKRSGYSVRCIGDNSLPSVTTYRVSVGVTSADAVGGVTSDGGSPVSLQGVCWSTSPNPTTLDSKTINVPYEGGFISFLTGLTGGTTYYVRAYAINGAGTGYGNQLIFTTFPDIGPVIFNPNLTYGSISDIDGNNYKTIQIGTQTWMAENLKTTKFRDGTNIPLVTENTKWPALSAAGYCWNNDVASHKFTYGAFYNWFAVVDDRNLCPTGWHIPSNTEWTVLTDFLGGETAALNKLKESGASHWIGSNSGTNESGFTALPGGYRHSNGTFDYSRTEGLWWSSTEFSESAAWLREINDISNSIISRYNYVKYGYTIRCVKD